MYMFGFSYVLLIALSMLPFSPAQAAVSLDRTRVIFDGGNKSVSLNIRNDNKEMPYLAQAWVENEHEKKVSGPIIVLPPLQRLEPNSGGQVKLVKSPEIESLPKDRESLFYFNLREVPPRSEQANTMQIALQTKIKLFYRPAAITPREGEVWQEKLNLIKSAGHLRLENPTPYYVTIVDLRDAATRPGTTEFSAVMLAPFTSQELKAPGAAITHPVLTYVSDYGGYQEQKYACAASTCQMLTGKQ
ncbi:fimbrial biogenesis chaperone [Pseudomonas sp. Au-Pse12]|uniref:fimbrial biogenesis chaperone n=1 Tax=Pseudomonas sp. Au-Pse12 TaxID=2906459 RepID=UPI001E3B5870|nr:molecular chaperone [Pseudomonas sp. Au-Pse12]MCE4057184.1 molecular chaperone [Pseudomonas sp. Au-Pse12]